MTRWVDSLTCRGQQPDGTRCGRVLGVRHGSAKDAAIAAGWRLGEHHGERDVICDRCARPDPELTRVLRDIEREDR